MVKGAGHVEITQSLGAIEKALKGVIPSRAEESQIRRKWRATMALAFKREALPAMRMVTPKRTGEAAKSLRVKTVAHPFGLNVGPGRKGFYLQFHPDVEELTQRYRNIIQSVWDKHSQAALEDAIAQVLNL